MARRAATCWTAPGCCASTPATSGSAAHSSADPGIGGWTQDHVPNVVERTRPSSNRRSPAASAGIARTSTCPARAKRLTWVVRFESVNYRAKVWLNGHLDREQHAAPTCRSSSRLPRGCSSATARNRLVVRVDDRRFPTDFPPSGLRRDRRRRPAAGGTTAASCARSTCARSTTIDFGTRPRAPDLPCATARDVAYKVTCATTGRRRGRFTVTGRCGAALSARHRRRRRRRSRRRSPRPHRACSHPQLWSPDSPLPLQRVADARAHGKRQDAARPTRACAAASARSRSSTAT